MHDHLVFLARFLRRPWRVGSIAPSSKALAALMTEDMGLEGARTVVELGPGTGVFTRAICERVAADALFVAVEIDPHLAALLRPRFPRVRIVNDSAEHLDRHLAESGRTEADAILSGLPWASFPGGLQRTLLTAAGGALRPGGLFATFAYPHASWLPPGRGFRALLQESFAAVETTRVVWANLPPAFVYRCRR